MDLLYWNPVPHIEAVQADVAYFGGKWEERNWRNVPGPFYGAMTDNCWVGRLHAPRHILYGDDIEYEQEFLFRPPSNSDELRAVLTGMDEDPWAGWACDGDSHWTPDLVREWWQDGPRLRHWITSKHRIWSGSDRADEREAAIGLMDYLAYIDGGLGDHLRAYMYFLENGVGPAAGDLLPLLR